MHTLMLGYMGPTSSKAWTVNLRQPGQYCPFPKPYYLQCIPDCEGGHRYITSFPPFFPSPRLRSRIIGIFEAIPFLSKRLNISPAACSAIHSFFLLSLPLPFRLSVLHTRSFPQSGPVVRRRQNSLAIDISPGYRPLRSHKVSSRLARRCIPSCHPFDRPSSPLTTFHLP